MEAIQLTGGISVTDGRNTRARIGGKKRAAFREFRGEKQRRASFTTRRAQVPLEKLTK